MPGGSPMIVSRNAPCACNSGLRYKHCCGSVSGEPASARQERARNAGLALQQRREFSRAIAIYDAILDEHPEDWNVAHMRATCYYQLGLMDDASRAFAAMLATPAVDIPGFWTNLGLVLASVCIDPWSPSLRNKVDAYQRFRPISPVSSSPQSPARAMPTVSVVMPAYMHAEFAGEAIASVIAQTRPPLEIIVIDDGSTDGTADCCREALRDAPFPARFIARENRGAAATLNEGIALARGDYIQLLNSDDRLPPNRIATMLAALVDRDAEWGYARVTLIDRLGRALDHSNNARAAMLIATQDAALMSQSLGLALLRANSAISTGNLMLRKRLWEALGGFRDLRYNHDWDFCLRATLECEPVLVPFALYDYRIHGRNTITEADNKARAEGQQLMVDFVAHAHGKSAWPNPFAPTLEVWGGEVLALLGATDALRHVPRQVIQQALSSASRNRIDG